MRIALLAAAFCVSTFAQTYRIAGVLVDGRSGKPIAQARITLTGGREPMGFTTAADGAFSFEAPQGKYSLNTEVHNWHQVYGMSGPSLGFGSAIITGPDQDTAHLTYRCFRPGSIYGRVTDDHGEGIENATVTAVREWVSGGRKVTVVAGTAQTDDLGNYRLGPVPSGTYYLAATATPWFVRLGQVQGWEAGNSTLNISYQTTYYPDSTDPRQAGKLAIDSGGEAQANLALRAVAAVTVHVACAAENCNGSMRFFSPFVGRLEALAVTGFFAPDVPIHGIAPGHYVVRVEGAGSMRKVVDLAGSDATIDVAFPPRPKITGVVTFQSGARPRGTPFVSMVNEDTNTSVGLTMDANGAFEYANPPMARLRPAIGGVAGYFISNLTASGAEVTDGGFDVVEGSAVELKIVASDEAGRVRGFVKSGDKPASGVLVVLAPRHTAAPAIGARGFQTDSDGSYDFTNVPSGDWALFTTDRMDLEYTEHKVMEPYLKAAVDVRVESHKIETVDLTISGK